MRNRFPETQQDRLKQSAASSLFWLPKCHGSINGNRRQQLPTPITPPRDWRLEDSATRSVRSQTLAYSYAEHVCHAQRREPLPSSSQSVTYYVPSDPQCQSPIFPFFEITQIPHSQAVNRPSHRPRLDARRGGWRSAPQKRDTAEHTGQTPTLPGIRPRVMGSCAPVNTERQTGDEFAAKVTHFDMAPPDPEIRILAANRARIVPEGGCR